MAPKLRKRAKNQQRQTAVKKPRNAPAPQSTSNQTEFGTSRINQNGSAEQMNYHPEASTAIDPTELMPASLNLHCRELFVGYFLRKDEGKFEQIYVDTKNNAFLVPEISMINFQRIFLMNNWFNCAVKSYFRYLHYHFSITSRPFEKFEFKDTNRMFYDNFNNSPSPLTDKHSSVVVFFNGGIIHTFKEANFFQLRKQKLFRDKAYSLTFDGSDSTKISAKIDLFTDLKALNFQTADDMSGVFQRLLNESFVSLKELKFFHQKFMSKLNDNTAFPPNLQSLCCTSGSATVMDFNANLYKKLFNVDVQELSVAFELLLRLNRLPTDEPILLNPKIEQLTVDWTNWSHESEISHVFAKLAVNAPSLKCIKFRKRQLQDLHSARYGFGGKRYLVARSMPAMFFTESQIQQAVEDLSEAVENENHIINGKFPFKLIFELGLFLFARKREDKVPNSKNPLDLQIVFYEPNKTMMRIMDNGKQVGTEVVLQTDGNIKDNIKQSMEALWVQIGEPNEITRFDSDVNTFSNHMV